MVTWLKRLRTRPGDTDDDFPEYEFIGEDITASACIVQAVRALEHAAAMSSAAGDIGGMVKVSHGWSKLANIMTDMIEEGHHHSGGEALPMGFYPVAKPLLDDKDDEYYDD